MEQMQIPSEMVADYNYNQADKIVQVLKPVIWQDGDSFCCLLGPDPMTGVFGCGDTADEAIDDWQEHLKDIMQRNHPDDRIVEEIKDKLIESSRISENLVQEFIDQFRPMKEK